MSFLISILVLLLYAAIAMLIIFGIKYFFEKIFGFPIPDRVMQLIYVIVALIFIIWMVQALVAGAPVLLPWQWGEVRRP